jgi:hypothetical protein
MACILQLILALNATWPGSTHQDVHKFSLVFVRCKILERRFFFRLSSTEALEYVYWDSYFFSPQTTNFCTNFPWIINFIKIKYSTTKVTCFLPFRQSKMLNPTVNGSCTGHVPSKPIFSPFCPQLWFWKDENTLSKKALRIWKYIHVELCICPYFIIQNV